MTFWDFEKVSITHLSFCYLPIFSVLLLFSSGSLQEFSQPFPAFSFLLPIKHLVKLVLDWWNDYIRSLHILTFIPAFVLIWVPPVGRFTNITLIQRVWWRQLICNLWNNQVNNSREVSTKNTWFQREIQESTNLFQL